MSNLSRIADRLPIVVAEAVEDAAERIAARAKVGAPVETPAHGPPMQLKNSIDTRPGSEPLSTEVVAEWYWFLAEYGHEAGGPGPRGGVTGKAAPRPFMIPAAEAERPTLVADLRRRLGNL